ncbi:MAG: class I SAM-dependent methyltransferase [Bacteroidota bacterium]
MSDTTDRSGFDWIAPIYDKLAGAVFGDALQRARGHFLSHIRTGDQVLIIGGGTGWILPEVLNRVGEKGQILYVEISAGMVQKSSQRILTHPNRDIVQFLQGTVQAIPVSRKFDRIITHFFLDLFTEQELEEVFECVYQRLRTRGRWLIADFAVPDNTWKLPSMLLLTIMYWFFRICCGISGKRIQDFRALFNKREMPLLDEQLFWKGLITSRVYRREESAKDN